MIFLRNEIDPMTNEVDPMMNAMMLNDATVDTLVNAVDTPIVAVMTNDATVATVVNAVDIPITAMMTNDAVCPSTLKFPPPTNNMKMKRSKVGSKVGAIGGTSNCGTRSGSTKRVT